MMSPSTSLEILSLQLPNAIALNVTEEQFYLGLFLI
ncbi:hypothetical protein cce_2264 [Crocosphaera subtropica ATCC 51142]|uniref:Uncharacterized protein n=1 Tax=Crocosphaera subtropica (strain ATCC 51142 / BH68) TaxID=43989 RepID=B1WPP4_CROS5|nr:hypothetical protein cce_2264 [Crocosphaera subtropica ATCC 51142]